MNIKGKKLSFLATLNGIGLSKEKEPLLRRVVAKAHGIRYPKQKKNANHREEGMRLLRCDVIDKQLADLLSFYVAEIGKMNFGQEKAPRPEPSLGGQTVTYKDYSGFPAQKRPKSWYKANGRKRRVGLTPRQFVFTTPQEYATPVAETAAPTIGLKPVIRVV